MVSRLSNSIADFYVSKNIITTDEKDVYKYGLELIFNDIVTFSLIIIISALLFNVRYSIEFLITFCFTRIYCGGYHAPKAYLCRLIMIITFLLVCTGGFILQGINSVWLLVMLGVSFLALFPLIPVKHPNKELTNEDIRKGKFMGTIVYFIFALSSLVVYEYVNCQDGILICLSLCAMTALAIIGTFCNKRGCNYEKNHE